MDERKTDRAPYRSELRARHAAQTRCALLDAATALFVARLTDAGELVDAYAAIIDPQRPGPTQPTAPGYGGRHALKSRHPTTSITHERY